MNPTSPPASPRQSRSQPGLLPIFVQQAETTQLLRPLAVVQQQQFSQPRKWSSLLQRLASRKAAVLFYALLAVMLVWYVAGGRAKPAAVVTAGGQQQLQSTIVAASSSTSSSKSSAQGSQVTLVASTLQQPAATGSSSNSSSGSGDFPADSDRLQAGGDDAIPALSSEVSSSSSSGSAGTAGGCPYGSLPGTWVGDAPTGAKWQLLDPHCQLTNWLEAYAAAAAAEGDTSSSSSSSSAEVLPTVNVLLLSDSVDRYIVQHVCDHLHGTKHTMHPTAQQQPPTAADADAAAAAAAASQQEPSASTSSSSSGGAPVSPGGPSNLNATAYAFHTCQLPEGVPLKLASSYFPGVHPTGPFHRGLTQNFNARISTAAAMWEEYAGVGQPPHVVSVASALWDVARLWLHERQQLEGQALSRPLLEGWVANFTAVVEYSKHTLPQAELWMTHTTMLPAHDVTTGLMTKPYLGRRYFIEQLNAAVTTAAQQLGLQLVDYAAVSSRFREGQAHLADLIHPNAEVALEVFNLLLNLALNNRGGP